MTLINAVAGADPFWFPDVQQEIAFDRPLTTAQFNNRVRVSPRLRAERTLLLIADGQSQSCSFIFGTHTPGPRVENFNFVDGGLYKAVDPLLGDTGRAGKGSFLTRLGDLLIKGGHVDRVILAPIGVNGSIISYHRSGGSMNARIGVLARRLQSVGLLGLKTLVLIDIGQSDSFLVTPQATFAAGLSEMIATYRANGITGPAFVALATFLNGFQLGAGLIRAAQASVVDNVSIFQGPDTDTLGLEYRDPENNTHYSAAGGDRLAAMWRDVIVPHLS